MKTYKELVENAPILEFDTDNASQAKEYFFRQGKKNFEDFNKVMELGIDKCIIFFPRSFNDCKAIYNKCVKIHEFKSASSISPIYLYNNELVIALCPLGGPAAANLVEELSFVGLRKFIAIGSCGCLTNSISLTSLFIPEKAIRDEGLSYHYMPASRTVDIDAHMQMLLEEACKKHATSYTKGIVWTIDAIYRETPNRTERRKKEGAVAVEMECASLAAVAKYNHLQFAELLYFTDIVGATKWEWRRYNKVTLRTKLLEICIDALRKA